MVFSMVSSCSMGYVDNNMYCYVTVKYIYLFPPHRKGYGRGLPEPLMALNSTFQY